MSPVCGVHMPLKDSCTLLQQPQAQVEHIMQAGTLRAGTTAIWVFCAAVACSHRLQLSRRGQ